MIYKIIIYLGAALVSLSLSFSLTSDKLGYLHAPVLLVLFSAFFPLLVRLFNFGFNGSFKLDNEK